MASSWGETGAPPASTRRIDRRRDRSKLYFWTYQSATEARKFLGRWCTKAQRSRIEPMQQVARMLRTHRPLLLNYFRAKRALASGP